MDLQMIIKPAGNILVHVIDRDKENLRYIQVINDIKENYIRENELVSLRYNINKIPYLKRMQEIDENNYEQVGYLVKMAVLKGYFAVVGNSVKCRLVSACSDSVYQTSLFAVPKNALFAICPENKSKNDTTSFYYYSESGDTYTKYYFHIEELEKAIQEGEIEMTKDNRWVVQFVINRSKKQ